MKTIKWLNEHWWYRLVKVAFIGFWLFCTVVSIAVVYSEYSPREITDYKVQCTADYSNKKTFYAYKDENIYVSEPYGTQTVYQSLYDYQKQQIRDVCDISKEESDKQNADALTYINEQTKLGTSPSVIQKYLDDNIRAYTLSKTYVTKGSYGKIVLFSLGILIIVAILAEAVRRIFYYITLGKIRPPKV